MPRSDAQFILRNTVLSHSRLLDGVALHLASEITPLWQATEEFLHAQNIAPPFWAFAWPGSEALARHVTDRPELVAGKSVLDFAAGCGLAGLAAAKAGAASVDAADIDPMAGAAIALNAAANGIALTVLSGEIVGQPCQWDVLLCGDIFYEAPMTRHVLPWLRLCARTAAVLVADPGRAYAPRAGVAEIARYHVPTSLELEDSGSREVRLFRLLPDVDPDFARD